METLQDNQYRLTTYHIFQQHTQQFPLRASLTVEQQLDEVKKLNFIDYVQCDNEIPEHSRNNLVDFPPTFKGNLKSWNDISDLMKNYAGEEAIRSQPRKKMVTIFTFQNRTLITPLLLFYLEIRLSCTKIHQSNEYTPDKCFKDLFSQEYTQEDNGTRSSIKCCRRDNGIASQ